MIDSTYKPAPEGIVGTKVPCSTPAGSWNVSAAHTRMANPMTPTSVFINFSNPPYPPNSTKANPNTLCSTPPQDCGIRPPVRLLIPSPVALVRAAVTATVHSTR